MNGKKIFCVIQARTGSTRLPGKVLFPIKHKPMIVHTIDRLKKSSRIDQIVLATTNLAEDQVLLDLASSLKIESFAGSENDVLDRFYQAGKRYSADIVVRCTGDCPTIDWQVTDRVIDQHLKNGNDYTSNTVTRSYPRGLDTEVIQFEALERSWKEAKLPHEREHVTPYLYQHPELFSIEQVEAEKNRWQPDLRLTVDTQEDFDFMAKIFDALYDKNPFFLVDDILNLLNQQPQLKEINRHVRQKPLAH